MVNTFETLLSYHLQMSYKSKRDLESKFWAANKNMATLHDLMKELKVNLTEL